MAVPISQMWTVATYVLKKRFIGANRYPLVLMLEPLFRCNLACAGCGKVQYPPHVLKRMLTPEECFAAVEECGAPMVSIPGGEPLLHPQIVEIVTAVPDVTPEVVMVPPPPKLPPLSKSEPKPVAEPLVLLIATVPPEMVVPPV